MQKIDQEGETVAMMSLTGMPVAQDEAAFSKICRRVERAEIRVLLSIGVIPTDTMVLGIFVILESQPISTFCG